MNLLNAKAVNVPNEFNNELFREIVQCESWLLKRGEGFDELDQGDNPNTAQAASRKRGGSIGDIKFDQAKFEKLMKGRGEKKRYFKLVTVEEKSAPGNVPDILKKKLNTNSVLKVELRYYVRPSDTTPKGIIVLDHTCEVITKLDETSFKLKTPGRSYYLRPDAEPSSAQAKTIHAQWIDGLKRQIRKLMSNVITKVTSDRVSNLKKGEKGRLDRADTAQFVPEEYIPTSLEETLRSKDHRDLFREFLENALASENLSFFEAVEDFSNNVKGCMSGKDIIAKYVQVNSPDQVNLSSAQRTQLVSLLSLNSKITGAHFHDAKAEIFKLMEDNFFKRYLTDTMDKTGAFAALYATLGFDGFKAIINHFGPMKTDLQRLLDTVKGKVQVAEVQVDLIRKELQASSREIAFGKTISLSKAQVSYYYVTLNRMGKLIDYVEELKEEVIDRMQMLMKKMDRDLEKILKSVEVELKDLETLRKLISESKKEYDAVREKGGEELQLAMKDLMECEHALETSEQFHSKAFERVMAKLESLELYRIQEQTRLLQHASMAETLLIKRLQPSVGDFERRVKALEEGAVFNATMDFIFEDIQHSLYQP